MSFIEISSYIIAILSSIYAIYVGRKKYMNFKERKELNNLNISADLKDVITQTHILVKEIHNQLKKKQKNE